MGIIFYISGVLLTSHYGKRKLFFNQLLPPRKLLPACVAQILDYFLISGVEQTSQEIYISLDEKMNPELIKDVHFESKGFMEAVSATDFPIRGHKVILNQTQTLTDLRTGKSFSIPIGLGYSCQGHPILQRIWSFFKRDIWRHPR